MLRLLPELFESTGSIKTQISARLALRQRLRQKTKAELKCLVNPNYTFFHMGPA